LVTNLVHTIHFSLPSTSFIQNSTRNIQNPNIPSSLISQIRNPSSISSFSIAIATAERLISTAAVSHPLERLVSCRHWRYGR